MSDNLKPQHDFDEQKRIRWEITQKGREALRPKRKPLIDMALFEQMSAQDRVAYVQCAWGKLKNELLASMK